MKNGSAGQHTGSSALLGGSRARVRARLRAVACALWLWPAVLYAGDVLDALPPERIGAKLAGVLRDVELTCRQDLDDARVQRCAPIPEGAARLGDMPLHSVEAVFRDERLEQVTIYFAESRFAGVKALVSDRLGQGQDASFSVRAGMAGTFTNEVIVWQTATLAAVLRQFDRKIDRSSLIYGSPDAVSPLLEQIRARPRGGGDL